MDHNTKIKYYFDNHAPVILSLSQIEATDALDNLKMAEAGHIKTRCLSTGWVDRNGVPIFQHDVVEYNYTRYGKTKTAIAAIKWDNGFVLHDNPSRYPIHATGMYLLNGKCKVIGNMIQNPELLPLP